MYSAVSLNDYDFTDTEMDDRDSIYFDTISVAGSEPNRKSLSLSRQTIYHSADDLPVQTTVPEPIDHMKKQLITEETELPEVQIDYQKTTEPHITASSYGRKSSAYIDVGDERDNAPPGNDEVSASLINNCNKDNKKLPITYSQWKSRTWRRFQDGQRSVDFILAYSGEDTSEENKKKRAIFEAHLESEKLQLERDETQRKIHFLKIHATHETLCRYCEILKMKMPIKKLDEQDSIVYKQFELMQEMKSFFGKPFEWVKLDRELFPEREYALMFEYSKNYDYLFDTTSENFFTPAIRNAVIYFILEQSPNNESNMGIEKLLADGVYQAAYPLHDGDCKTTGSKRHLLLNEWASIKKWIKHQPLDDIKDYFGVKVAMYFAWLGFYTHMLIPAAIGGFLCFFYGIITLGNDKISQDICHANNSILMCPQCDIRCDYWLLNETCTYSKISYIFDNRVTVVFAIFMSFWAVLYLELWKRYIANIAHRWGLTNYCHQAEPPRPQFLARLKNAKRHKLNTERCILEPHVPFWKMKFPVNCVSFSIVLFFISLAIAAVFGVVIFRMSTTTSKNLYGNTESASHKIMVTPITAGIINLVVITILNFVYDLLAAWLTDLEYRRTKTEYDDSLSLKIYLFQFVNYYSSIFYIAFIKGKFVGYPAKYNRIFGFRQEECSPGGCLMELCIQLVIIMVGKQAINAVMENFIPYISKKLKTYIQNFNIEDKEKLNLITCNQWTEDFKLLAWTQQSLFEEYLEMIIQFGFITLFITAFPLAPLFALFNNVIEMRTDAKKFLKYYRRPVSERVKDIGIWYNIMAVLSRISVASSAFIIAFSSNFIPMLVYMINVNPDHTDTGYLNYTLATFNTEDFEEGIAPSVTKFENVLECRYAEFRNPPNHDSPYKRPVMYWHILVARLAFIVIFQNILEMVQMLVAWAIPDKPGKLQSRIKREEYLTREIIIQKEKDRVRANRPTNPSVHFNSNITENGNIPTDVEMNETPSQSTFRRRQNNININFNRTTPV